MDILKLKDSIFNFFSNWSNSNFFINNLDNIKLICLIFTFICTLITLYKFFIKDKSDKIKEKIIKDNEQVVELYYKKIDISNPKFIDFVYYCDQLQIYISNLKNFKEDVQNCQKIKIYFRKKEELLIFFSKEKLNNFDKLSLELLKK